MIEEFRKEPPIPLAPKPFNISQPNETVLDNGLRVILFEDDRFPIVSYRLAFRTGDINDPKDIKGLTSAMTAMLTQGTLFRTSRQLAEDVDRLGASLHAGCSSDNTIISGSALTAYSSEILKLMAEILLSPAFPETELALYKENTIKGLEFQRSQADFLAEEQTARIVYGTHPYGVVGPGKPDVEALSREMLIEHHRRTLVPNNALFIAVGNLKRDELLRELSSLVVDWEKGEIAEPRFETPPDRNERTLTIVDRIGSAQSNIVLSNLGLKRTDPDYFPVILMNQILGSGGAARLFMNLREEKGYTYGAYSSFDSRRFCGSFEATAEVRTAVTGESLKEFFYELEKIRNEPVSLVELQDAKNFLTGVFPIRAETQEGLTNLIVSQKLYGLPDDYLQTYRGKVAEVAIEDVQRVANKYILPDKLAIIIVGDADEILKQAGSYAEKIEIFDTLGNLQDIDKYFNGDHETNVDVQGKWDLLLDFQGQEIPVYLVLKQDGEEISGVLETMFGNGEIASGSVRGNQVSATAKIEFQGKPVEFNISGKIIDEVFNGELTSKMVPAPLAFTGKKAG